MRILLNGIPLLSPRSGVGNYVYFLGEALRRAGSEHDWRFHYLTFQSSQVRTHPVSLLGNVRGQLRNVPGVYSIYRNAIETLFRLSTWRKGIDLYHETNYAPFPFRGATIVTVYDLSIFHSPETHPKERVKFYERYFFPRLGRINHFLAISEFVKMEMIRDLGIAPERITVTPLGLDAQYHPSSSQRISEGTSKYGLTPGCYILSVGTKEPRKNLKRLLAAYASMPDALRRRFPLVMVGGTGWLLEEWATLLSQWGLTSQVRILGFVPQEDLPVLYGGAALLAYPSLYEGFGLPPLEAMGCGCPVLTSNVSSLPEVVGEAALTVDPLNVDEISAGLIRILEDPTKRDRMSNLGLERAKLFNWDRCALLTLGVYKHVVKNEDVVSPGESINIGIIDVGIVFYEGIDDLRGCLDSVATQSLPCRVSVRDNGHDPRTVDALLETRKGVVLLRDGRNLGYAGGANDLIRSSKGPFILILNPDVKLTPDYVEKLVAVMKADPRVGVAGGKLLREEGVIDNAGIFSRRTFRSYNRGEGERDLGQYKAGEVMAITGAAILLRRSMLEDVSPLGDYFDPDFFIYREESDLCRRAGRRGWKIWFEPEAVAFHRRAWRKGGRRNMSRVARFHSFKNRYLEMVKNETWSSFWPKLPWILSFEMAQLAYVLVQEPFLLKAYGAAFKLLPSMIKKRRAMMSRPFTNRRVDS